MNLRTLDAADHTVLLKMNYPSSGGVVSWSDSYRTSHTVCAFGWKLFVVVWHFRFASRVSLSFYLNVHVFIDSLRGKSLKSMQQTKWWLVDDFWSFWTLFLSVVNTDPERRTSKNRNIWWHNSTSLIVIVILVCEKEKSKTSVCYY